MLHLRAASLDDTRAIAGAVAGLARSGDLIVLAGEMGAGKTAFAAAFGAALGVREPVTSPTYTLVHSYAGGDMPLHHADLYRLGHTSEVSDLAIDELLDDGVVLVEWGDVVDLGPQLQIALARVDAGDEDDADDADANTDDGRQIDISCSDPRWQHRWPRLQAALQRWAAA